jgi:predicted transcriptional regulator
MSELFLNEKPVRAMIVLRQSAEDMYSTKISQKIDTTYAHTVKIISRLEDKGLVRKEKQGRRKYISLTAEGERHAEKFQELLKTIDSEFSVPETEVSTRLEMQR